MKAWDVYLNGKLLTTVYYDEYCDAEYVKRTLVEHDNYDPAITIVRRKLVKG